MSNLAAFPTSVASPCHSEQVRPPTEGGRSEEPRSDSDHHTASGSFNENAWSELPEAVSFVKKTSDPSLPRHRKHLNEAEFRRSVQDDRRGNTVLRKEQRSKCKKSQALRMTGD